jgi:hypothetical protein
MAVVLALGARERAAELRGAAFIRQNPGARHERRIVSHVLRVTTLEIGDPVAVAVQPEAANLARAHRPLQARRPRLLGRGRRAQRLHARVTDGERRRGDASRERHRAAESTARRQQRHHE